MSQQNGHLVIKKLRDLLVDVKEKLWIFLNGQKIAKIYSSQYSVVTLSTTS